MENEPKTSSDLIGAARSVLIKASSVMMQNTSDPEIKQGIAKKLLDMAQSDDIFQKRGPEEALNFVSDVRESLYKEAEAAKTPEMKQIFGQYVAVLDERISVVKVKAAVHQLFGINSDVISAAVVDYVKALPVEQRENLVKNLAQYNENFGQDSNKQSPKSGPEIE